MGDRLTYKDATKRQEKRAINELSDIAAWLPLLTAQSLAVYGVRSARVTPARCARHNGLPFGLDHRIDQTDDGWPGIRTHVGALKSSPPTPR